MEDSQGLAVLEPIKVRASAQDRDVTVIASNAEEMQVAQQILIGRMEFKIQALAEEATDLETNLAHAKQYKLRQTAIQSSLSRTKRRIEFYSKMRDAFQAGYTLIPDMDVEVFAIRTTRKTPKDHYTSAGDTMRWVTERMIRLPNQESDRAPSGEGEYVSPRAVEQRSNMSEAKNEAGQTIYSQEAWAEDWNRELVFPFALAKPRIMEATTQAMALRIFDDIGVLPRRTRNADPMVVGRVLLKEGYGTRAVNFLICWFVDTRVL